MRGTLTEVKWSSKKWTGSKTGTLFNLAMVRKAENTGFKLYNQPSVSGNIEILFSGTLGETKALAQNYQAGFLSNIVDTLDT